MIINIKIDTIEKVKNFVNNAALMPFDVTIRAGKYVVDGKSLMAIFSLDLEKPIAVEFDSEDIGLITEAFGRWECEVED